MFACLLGLASLHWTQWVNDHSALVVRIMEGLAVGIVLCFLFWLFTNDNSNPKNGGQMSKTTHGPNSPIGGSGKSMTASGDIKKIKAKNYYEAPPAAPPPPEPKPDPKSNFVISKPVPHVVRFNRVYWQLDEKGQLGTIFKIHNKPAGVGGQTGQAHAVSVSLTFREKGTEIARISHACLIGHRENAMNFENDDHCDVLICTSYPPSLKVYDNKTNIDQNVYLGHKPLPSPPFISNQLISFSELLEIDVKVKSGPDTLAEKTFQFIKTPEQTLYVVGDSK